MGCSDFLDEKDPSNLTPDSFYTIPDHAEAALAAVYADLRFMGGGAGIFSSNWQLLEALTGTSTTETAQNSDLNNLYSLVQDGNTVHVVNYWNGLYRVIANANQVLDKVPPITPMNDAQKAKILGEARFLRASAYFMAVQLWGDIPLITTPQTATTGSVFAHPRAERRRLQAHRGRPDCCRSGRSALDGHIGPGQSGCRENTTGQSVSDHGRVPAEQGCVALQVSGRQSL